jgi:cystathionine gamma-lyase
MSPSILTESNGINGVNGHSKSNGLKKVTPKVTPGFGTRAIHVGSAADKQTGAVIPPISLSTTYKQEAIGVHKVCRFSFDF